MVSNTELFDLFKTLSSILIALASFVFTWLRTRPKGPNVQIIDIEQTSIVTTPKARSLFDSTHRSQWKFNLSFEGDKKVNLLLIVQNTGDRNAFIRLDNMWLIGLAGTGEAVYPNQKSSAEYQRFFINPNPWQDLPIVHQIPTNELSLIELSFQIPEGCKKLSSFVFLIDIRTWDHKGRESYIIANPSIYTSIAISDEKNRELLHMQKNLMKKKRRKPYTTTRKKDFFHSLFKNFLEYEYFFEEHIENHEIMSYFNDESHSWDLFGSVKDLSNHRFLIDEIE